MSVTGFTQSVADYEVYLAEERLWGITSVRVQAKRDYTFLPHYGTEVGTVLPGHTRYLIRLERNAPLNQPVDWQDNGSYLLRIVSPEGDYLYIVRWISLSEQVDKNGKVVSVVELVATGRTENREG